MLLLRAVPVVLSAGERTALTRRVRGAKTALPGPAARADRAGCSARPGQCADRRGPAASAWTPCANGGAGSPAAAWTGWLTCPGSGRPRRIGELDRAAVVALACQLPAATGVPLAHWTGPELAAELAARGLASPMPASSVLRILAEHPVRPWQYQSWIYPRDP